MNVEIMLLLVMGCITVLAGMIAINAHGLVRLILSYFLTCFILAAMVWSIVQYVNTEKDIAKTEEIKKEESLRKLAEERAQSQEIALKINKERMAFAGKLNIIITFGAASATSMITVDVQDKSFELETLIKRATEIRRRIESVKLDFEKLSTGDGFFNEPLALCRDAMKLLSEASYYYFQYYSAEDSAQEVLRERIMREKARVAFEKFQKAGELIATSG